MRQPATCPYTMRPMKPGDIPMVVAIDRLSFPTPWSASTYLYELNRNHRSFYFVLLSPPVDDPPPKRSGWHRWMRSLTTRLDFEQSQVVGYAGFRHSSAEAHISTIAVHPDWRGKGLGELLLLTALTRAIKLNSHKVTLEVRATNQVAQRLYRKYRFRFTGIHRAYYRDGEDAWLMAVDLDSGAYEARLVILHQLLEERLNRQLAVVGQGDRHQL